MRLSAACLVTAFLVSQTGSARADERILFPGSSASPAPSAADEPAATFTSALEAQNAASDSRSLDKPPVEAPQMAVLREPKQTFSDQPEADPAFTLPPSLTGYHVRVAPYGWLPEMYGQTTIRNFTTDFGITTRDMLNLVEHNVHFMFAGQMEVEQGPWTAMATGLYIYAGFGNSIGRLNFDGKFSFAIVDAALAYEIEGLADALYLPGGTKFEALAGGRYWLLDGGVSVTGTGPLGLAGGRDSKREWVDPVVGGRFTLPLSPTARVRVRGDVGGFDWWGASRFTWNVEAMYEHRLSTCCTLLAGYRILDVDYQRGGGRDYFRYDAQLRGPVSSLAFDF